MTPKEKAQELVEKFMNVRSIKMSDYSRIYHPTAKQCALITVDEMLSTIGDAYEYNRQVLIPFWTNVRKEIEEI